MGGSTGAGQSPKRHIIIILIIIIRITINRKHASEMFREGFGAAECTRGAIKLVHGIMGFLRRAGRSRVGRNVGAFQPPKGTPAVSQHRLLVEGAIGQPLACRVHTPDHQLSINRQGGPKFVCLHDGRPRWTTRTALRQPSLTFQQPLVTLHPPGWRSPTLFAVSIHPVGWVIHGSSCRRLTCHMLSWPFGGRFSLDSCCVDHCASVIFTCGGSTRAAGKWHIGHQRVLW